MENGLDDMCALLTESKLQTSDGLANFLAQIANVDLRADHHVQVSQCFTMNWFSDEFVSASVSQSSGLCVHVRVLRCAI